MMMQSSLWSFVRASLVVGLIFSPIAAIMAFLITYAEYRHHFPHRAPAVRHAMHMALVTLAAFLILSVIAGLLAGHAW